MKQSRKVELECEYCGQVHSVYISAIRRGRGMFCSSHCAQCTRHRPKVEKVCPKCGITFITTTNRTYCSLTCRKV